MQNSLRLAGVALWLAVLAACGAPEMPALPPPAASSPAGVASAKTPEPASMPDSPSARAAAAFDRLATRFLAEYLKRQPVGATQIGDHAHDGEWPDMSAAGDAETRRFVVATRAELAAIKRELLSEKDAVDAAILDNQLAYGLFELDENKEAEWSPLVYTTLIGDGIDPLLTRSFAPVEARMKSLRSRLEGVPAIVAAAKARLVAPPKIHVETAIEQNRGLIELCEHGLVEEIAKVPADRAGLEAAAKKAATALHELQTFLENDLGKRATGSFRLGRARFEKKLRFVLEDDVDIDAVATGARELLVRTQGEMLETAKELWPSLMGAQKLPSLDTPEARKRVIRAVLDELAKDRPDNATIVRDAERVLGEATAFVKQKALVGLPEEPCRVIEMPEYRRGVAVAYCDSSGPLEEKQETFFAIAPTPKDWPEKRVTSFYREYNHSMLVDLTVHEAMPGHFLQAMHGNKFKSAIRAVFSSGAFVEGWAVYTEWLMQKYGFGGPKARMQRQKMVLRLSANAILDHEIHAGAMGEKEALSLMTGEAFQEEGESVGKWKRARLTSAQLTTYFYGFTEMMRLRERSEKAPGFQEQSYHDRLLSYGAPAMKHLRALLLDGAASGPKPPPSAARKDEHLDGASPNARNARGPLPPHAPPSAARKDDH